ncbi:MAG: hypothetical protein Q7T47_01235, partial [Anaerolineales bacterium]|nr:hypothetical protein [Anaerolineales bacterium]
ALPNAGRARSNHPLLGGHDSSSLFGDYGGNDFTQVHPQKMIGSRYAIHPIYGKLGECIHPV